MSKQWSTYQTAIFDFVENDKGNAIVEAVAGSGKTTTIVEALSRCVGSTIFLAFNKSIAEELKERGVDSRTFHSLTYAPVTRAKGVRSVDANKLRGIVRDKFTEQDNKLYGNLVVKLVGLARQAGVGCLVDDVPNVWAEIIDHHDLEIDEGGTLPRAIELAQKTLALSNRVAAVDFDDLLYLAVKDGISLPKFDIVFVDEAQDTNAIQRAILRKILKPGSRVIAVGDPAQAIYGFRGADSRSMDLIAEEFQATRLPLTVSYRCATSIVNFARQWVAHIEAAPGAAEGSVEQVEQWGPQSFDPKDLIVCRTTAPLVKLAYQMLKAKVPARILGREIGEGLIALVEKLNAAGIERLIDKLSAWEVREVEKAWAKDDEAKAQAVSDKADAIRCVIEGLPQTSYTVPALVEAIRSLFDGAKGATTLATIHKSKGLEADRVWWLNSSMCPSPWARKEWQQQQEINLCYVAATRAKTQLKLIEAQ